MSPRSYPRIGDPPMTRHTYEHPTVEVTWSEGTPTERYCGDNGCSGTCRLPALILPGQTPDLDRKCSGSQVAFGQAFQQFRAAVTFLHHRSPAARQVAQAALQERGGA